MRSLDESGIPYRTTAREFAQTRLLLEYWNVPHTMVGAHGGKSKVRKVLKLLERTGQLMMEVRKDGIQLAVSHGSRSQVTAARLMAIRSLVMLDYEYTETTIFNALATYILMPSLIPEQRLRSAGINMKKLIRYDGFKEELYLSSFVPDPGFRKEIGVADDQVLVTVRPPGIVGNYHDSRSESLLLCAIDHVSSVPNAVCLVVHKTSLEKDLILSHIGTGRANVRFQEKAVDGLQLLFHSDIAISGGGTMNRESALLGTETYSIFTGRKPYLDEFLESEGKLRFLDSNDDVKKIEIARRKKSGTFALTNRNIVSSVSSIIKEKALHT